MKRLVILGASGMLGGEVARMAKLTGIPFLAISRDSEITLDLETMAFEQLGRQLNLCENDWLVNCIGWIPQKPSGDLAKDIRLANLLNISLPDQLSTSRAQLGFNWIQVATDCAFQGTRGSYSEADVRDAEDLYGSSKITGEGLSQGAIQIRCSIVGRDSRTSSGLYSWFKSVARRGQVKGYVNHFWNGVSTTAFARLSIGMLQEDWGESMNQHWIPSDSLNKYELLQLFAKTLGLEPDVVIPVEADASINRTLATVDQNASDSLWMLAGYSEVPSIHELCQEFIEADTKIGLSHE